MKKFFNRETLQKIALGGLGLSTLVLFVFMLWPKPSPESPKNPPSTNTPEELVSNGSSISSPSKVEFVEKEPQEWRNVNTLAFFDAENALLASKAVVYKKTSGDSELSDQEATQIAQKFGFSGLPLNTSSVIGKVWTWQSGDKSLVVDLSTQVVEYSDVSIYRTTTDLLIFSKEEAEKLAKQKVQELGFGSVYMDLNNPETSFFSRNETHASELKTESGEIAYIAFPLKLGGEKLLVPGGEEVVLQLDSKGGLLGFKVPLYNVTLDKDVEVGLISLDQVKVLVENMSGVMVQNASDNFGPQVLKSYTVDKIALAYYAKNTTQTFVRPIYVLSGSGVLEDGSTSIVELYLPATY